MEQEVLSILLADISEYNVNRLCELCNIRDYQAIKYISLYQRLDNNIRQLVGMDTTNFVKNRDKVLHKLVKGEYSTNEAKANDYKNEVIKYLQSEDFDQAVNDLVCLCNIAEGDAAVFVEKYKSIKYNENMLSSLETKDAVADRWKIINLLSGTFIPDRPF